MKERFLEWIKRLPLDLGQGWYRHTTKAKILAFSFVSKGHGRRALDFGCGDGFWSEKMKQQGWNVVSIDGYDLRYPGVQHIDAEKLLPFPTASFDCIWLSEVLEHIHHHEQLLNELRRILVPGGRLIVTTPNSAFWVYNLLRIWNIMPRDVQNPDHKQFFSFQDIRTLFPTAKIFGFFPYMIFKFSISRGVGPLSPTFVIVEEKA